MCFNPIRVNYHSSYQNYRGVLIHPYNKGRIVNCGKCIECRERYIESWQVRWMEQLKSSEPNSNYMLTLTYADEYLSTVITPDGEEITVLNYTDVQKFFKRLRKKQETVCKKNNIFSPKIKYHGCGEYGKNFTKRPHYHVIVTNLIINPDLIEGIWKLGKVHVGTDVTHKTINYILKYTLKFTHSDNKPIKKVDYHFKNIVIQPFPTDYFTDKYSSCYSLTIMPQGRLLVDMDVLINKKTIYKYYPKAAENQYRVVEKSFVSKGIGEAFLTEKNINYYLENPHATYDYYDEKKKTIVNRPLPRYYYDKIYNPIKKDIFVNKNLYDENKRPIRVYDKKDIENYMQTPLFRKQKLVYDREQNMLNQLLKKYCGDMDKLVREEKATRDIRKTLSHIHIKKTKSYQKYNNKARNQMLI